MVMLSPRPANRLQSQGKEHSLHTPMELRHTMILIRSIVVDSEKEKQ